MNVLPYIQKLVTVYVCNLQDILFPMQNMVVVREIYLGTSVLSLFGITNWFR